MEDSQAESRPQTDAQEQVSQAETSSQTNARVVDSKAEAGPEAAGGAGQGAGRGAGRGAARARALAKILPGVVAWRCEGHAAGHLQVSKWNITEDGQLVLTCPRVGAPREDSRSSQGSAINGIQPAEKPLVDQAKPLADQDSSKFKKSPSNADRVKQTQTHGNSTNSITVSQQRPPAQPDTQIAGRGRRRLQNGRGTSRPNRQTPRANAQNKQNAPTGNQRTHQPVAAAGTQRRQQSPSVVGQRNPAAPAGGIQQRQASPRTEGPKRQQSPSPGGQRFKTPGASVGVRRATGSNRAQQRGQRRSPALQEQLQQQLAVPTCCPRAQQLSEPGRSRANQRHRPVKKGAWLSRNPLAAMAASVHVERYVVENARPRCCERIARQPVTPNVATHAATDASDVPGKPKSPKDDLRAHHDTELCSDTMKSASNQVKNDQQPMSIATFVENTSTKDMQIIFQPISCTAQHTDKDARACTNANLDLVQTSLVNARDAHEPSMQIIKDDVCSETPPARSFTLPEISTWSFPLPVLQGDQTSELQEDADLYSCERKTEVFQQRPEHNLCHRQRLDEKSQENASELYTDPCLQTLAQASLQVEKEKRRCEKHDENQFGKPSGVQRRVHTTLYKHPSIKQQHSLQGPKHIPSPEVQDIATSDGEYQARTFAAQKYLADDVNRFHKRLSALAEAVQHLPAGEKSEEQKLPDKMRHRFTPPSCEDQYPHPIETRADKMSEEQKPCDKTLHEYTTSNYEVQYPHQMEMTADQGNFQMQSQLLGSISNRLVVPQPDIMELSTSSIRQTRSKQSRRSEKSLVRRNPSTSSRRSDTSNGSISNRDRKSYTMNTRVNKKLASRRAINIVDTHSKRAKRNRENNPLKVVSTHSNRCQVKTPTRPRIVTRKNPPAPPLLPLAPALLDSQHAEAAYTQRRTFAPAPDWNRSTARASQVPPRENREPVAEDERILQCTAPPAWYPPAETVNSQLVEARERLTMAVSRALRPPTSFQPIIEETIKCVEDLEVESNNDVQARPTSLTHRDAGSEATYDTRSHSPPQSYDAHSLSASNSDDSFTVKSLSLNSFSPKESSVCGEVERMESESESRMINTRGRRREDSRLSNREFGTTIYSYGSDSSSLYSQSSTSLRQRPFLQRVHHMLKSRFFHCRTRIKDSCGSSASRN